MATLEEFEVLLTEFKDRANSLADVIVRDLEDLKKGRYGCKTSSVGARNKLKELIDISKRLKIASLLKSKSLPKRDIHKKKLVIVKKPIEYQLIEKESLDILDVMPQ